jgi:galactarate dehydratase
MALCDIDAGGAITRYGQTIGIANRAIAAGSWVREELMDMPAAPPLEELPLATLVPAKLPALEAYTFEGYRNPDGSVGTKNILGIATTVQCVAPTVDYAVRRIQAELLPRFPNVDGALAVTHSYGCGVAIDAPGAAVPIATLKHIGMHANIGGQPMIVSLGCEKLQPARLFGSDLPILGEANVIRLQDERGFEASVAAILEAAERRLAVLNRRQRQTAAASELVVGLQCGGRIRGRPVGARGRDGDVLGGDGGARRDSSADAAGGDAGCGARADSRDALV